MSLKKTIISVLSACFFVCILCFAANAYTDTTHVAYVNGTYTVTGSETGIQGQTAEYPFTTFGEAYSSLFSTGGTVVVTGRTSFSMSGLSFTTETRHTEMIYITSDFEGTDYAETADARFVITGSFHALGDVTYENLHFITRMYTFIHGNGHKMIFGEGIEVTQGTAADMNYSTKVDGVVTYLDSPQNLVIRAGGEGVNYTGGTYLEINSGVFGAIHCATKNRDIGENVEVVINGGTISSINLGNDSGTSSGIIHGDIIVNINAPMAISFAMGYISAVEGSLNISANNGATYTLRTLSATPAGGTYIVSSNGNGTVEAMGGGEFHITPDTGYVYVNESYQIYGDASFYGEGDLTAVEGTTNITFMNRSAKPAPIYVYATPTTNPEKNNGIIRNTSSQMEYRLSGTESFTSAAGNTIENLSVGVYEVRYKAENGNAAGDIRSVTVTDRNAEIIVNEALTNRTERINEIRNTDSALNPEDYETVYYISESTGDDSNDGLSPTTAWKTLQRHNSGTREEIPEGSLVLFKRGDMWRERLTAKSGVDYSAYGSGAKPVFNGSPEDGASAEKWSLMEGTTNIWVYYKDIPDVGVIVFNDGEENAIKEIPDYYDGTFYVRGTGATVEFTVQENLDNDLEFFNLYTAGQSSAYIPLLTKSTLYLRCDRGNPGTVFDSIEFNVRGHGITHTANTTFDNLCVKYAGSHGFGGGATPNVKHMNCEVGWIGGVVQFYKKSTAGEYGTVTRFGNGIEVWQNCDDFRIDNCYVYQCYDAGITNQGRGSSELSDGTFREINAYMTDVYFTNNVLEYNVYNIEYFLSQMAPEYTTYQYPMMTNVFYTGNLMYYAGYGFGKQRPNPGSMTHIRSGGENPAVNFHINNNTFFDSVNYCTVTLASQKSYLPEYDGNIFIQTRDRYFAKHGTGSGVTTYFDENVRLTAITQLGDENAEMVYLEKAPSLIAVRNGDTVILTGLAEKINYSIDGGNTWIPYSESETATISVQSIDAGGILAYTSGYYDSYPSEEVTVAITSGIIGIPFKLERDYDAANLYPMYEKESYGGVYGSGAVVTVKDSDDAEVCVVNENEATPSQADDGSLILTFSVSLENGSYTAKIQKNGYVAATVPFTVSDGCATVTTTELACGDIKGDYADISGDGYIDIDDFLRLLRAYKTNASVTLKNVVDLNEDGYITVNDIVIVKGALLNNQ